VGVEIVIPALMFRTPSGDFDPFATQRYAHRAARTWIDRFILSGSTTRGDLLSVAERAAILDLWVAAVEPSRLVACCWCDEDMRLAGQRGIRPIVVMRGLETHHQALAFFAQLPAGAYVYSHPRHTPITVDGTLASAATEEGILPGGAKLAKAGLDDIAAVRDVAGPGFTLWDGSSRHIRASIRSGASGVVATPLADLPMPFPARSITAIQAVTDEAQRKLDRHATRRTRLNCLLRSASRGSTAPPPAPPGEVRQARRRSDTVNGPDP